MEGSLCRLPRRCQSTAWSDCYHNPIKCNELSFTPINPSQPRIGAILSHWYLRGLSHWLQKLTNSLSSLLNENLECALQHPDTVSQYLVEEIAHYRVAGPFKRSTIPDAHISRFGVIPKNHQPNKWRLIIDLSHPASRSVNDGIPKNLCSLTTYITVDSAIQCIQLLGQGTLLAKIDIKSAFRLLPVHPSDHHLLAMDWDHSLYINTCLPFWLRSAPKLFNVLANLLSWILTQKRISPLFHYLDDFLLLGPPGSSACANNLAAIKEVRSTLGIPLALEKVEGPSHSLTFLGHLGD